MSTQLEGVVKAGAFTTYLLDYIAANTTDILVGDGITPPGGGPLKGQPGVEGYAPYVVLIPTRIVQDGQDIWGRSGAWRLTYSYEVYGGSRKQCDVALDDVRTAMDALLGRKFAVPPTSGETWIMQNLNWRELGSPTRDSAGAPPFWKATDSFTMFATKGGVTI